MLDLSNIINITAMMPGARQANANTSVLALFTHDEPLFSNYGEFRIYVNPNGVADDFGSNSRVAKMANKVFGQTPNILSGGGYLVVIPLLGDVPAAPARISLPARDLRNLPTDGVISFNVNGEFNALALTGLDKTTLATLQASLNGFFNSFGLTITLSGEMGAADIEIATTAVGANASIAITESTGSDINDLGLFLNAIGFVASGIDNGEEQLKEAILRTMDKVYYFGIMFDEISDLPYSNSRLKEVAQLMQGLNKILTTVTNLKARVMDNFQAVANSSLSHTRCLYKGGTIEDALMFQAAYMGRAMSVNYKLENSAITMYGKTLAGIAGDSTIDQTFYAALEKAGTDFYGDFGSPMVVSNGANGFYDNIVNLLAIILHLQVAHFNVIKSTATKIPQTEGGMETLKSEGRKVLEMFKNADVLAPGEWNDPYTIGDRLKQIQSIRDLGYWIYSTPIAQQSQADRETRIAPGVYYLVKFSGAVHGMDVVLFMEV